MPDLTSQITTDLEFSSQVCSVCHGDISLSNVTIHRIFCGHNDKEVDGDDVQDTCIEDIKSKINIFATPAEADIVTATPTEAGIVTASPTEAGIDKNTVRNDNNLTDSDDVTKTGETSITEAMMIVSELDVTSPITETHAPSNVTSLDNAAASASVSPTTSASMNPTASTSANPADSASANFDPHMPISAHGLVIDNDNSFSLDEIEKYGYRANSVSCLCPYFIVLYLNICQGTLPFMALESLKWRLPSEFTHEPRHDLESLFYVILTLCTYVNSAGCLRSPIALDDELSVCVNEWWATLDGHVLVRNKAQHITSLDDLVLQRLPPYWKDFHPYLRALREVIWPGKDTNVLHAKNAATHEGFLEVLTKAKDFYRESDEVPAPFAPISDRQIAHHTAMKRKGKDSDTYIEAKRIKTIAEATLSLNRNRPQSQRSNPASAPIMIRRTSARLAGVSAGPGI